MTEITKNPTVPTHPRDAMTTSRNKTVTRNPRVTSGTKETPETSGIKNRGLLSKLAGGALKNLQHRKDCMYSKKTIIDMDGNPKSLVLGSSIICQHGKLMHAYSSKILGYNCWAETSPILNPMRYSMNRNKLKQVKRR